MLPHVHPIPPDYRDTVIAKAKARFPTLKEAKEYTGHKTGLGNTKKMPGLSTALSAFDCITGALLRKVKGTVCSYCYAFGGNYQYPDVKAAHARRTKALTHPDWVLGMVRLIDHYVKPEDPYFRWHDSGDVQSFEHLVNIVAVADATPGVNHWIPTKEYAWLMRYLREVGPFPSNLAVRPSAPKVGSSPPKSLTRRGLLTSTVDWSDSPDKCPATHQHYETNGECGDCRKCWDLKVPNVDYMKHR